MQKSKREIKQDLEREIKIQKKYLQELRMDINYLNGELSHGNNYLLYLEEQLAEVRSDMTAGARRK